jgi:hypothetical protein
VLSGEIGTATVDGAFEFGRISSSCSAGFEGVDRSDLFFRMLAKDLEDLVAANEATVVFDPRIAHCLWVFLVIRVFNHAVHRVATCRIRASEWHCFWVLMFGTAVWAGYRKVGPWIMAKGGGGQRKSGQVSDNRKLFWYPGCFVDIDSGVIVTAGGGRNLKIVKIVAIGNLAVSLTYGTLGVPIGIGSGKKAIAEIIESNLRREELRRAGIIP